MKRGESAGGGQSSLGYLFGSNTKEKIEAAPPSPTTFMPPYGIDTGDDVGKPPETLDKTKRVHAQNSGIFITGRPSTKVSSPPGGGSSLGYLFGDKS
ncbi:protein SPIRAL1-like 5 [Salvia miltiorrhiza]|uniref:protein SPIRAL1-like 5 n=1 Tax=Salvia miltiorrhiza TaxID=226208 RepID=UPI0025ACD44D|nr:protein SPIRAL1-like 5 [Salvia miltiorrhiza]